MHLRMGPFDVWISTKLLIREEKLARRGAVADVMSPIVHICTGSPLKLHRSCVLSSVQARTRLVLEREWPSNPSLH
jgi:hypothetical protein